MYAILALAVSIMLATFMTGVAKQHHDLTALYQSRSKSIKTQTMAENIQQYRNEKNAYPASIDALSATPGFQHVQSLTDAWQGYDVSDPDFPITDSVWQFQRAVFFSNDPSKGVNATAYLADNKCGSGTNRTALSWCGARTGQWFRSETREQYNAQISTQRIRMGHVLQKIADYYSANQKFPDKDKSNNSLTNDSIHKLTELAGYSGSATECTGTYQFMGTPIDCADMFDLWGKVIGYQYMDSKHIILISETPIFNADSPPQRIIVAADFDNTQL